MSQEKQISTLLILFAVFVTLMLVGCFVPRYGLGLLCFGAVWSCFLTIVMIHYITRTEPVTTERPRSVRLQPQSAPLTVYKGKVI